MRNENLSAGGHGNNHDFLAKCSFCSSDLPDDALTLLEEREQKTTWHATCGRCRTSAIIFLSDSQAGMVSLGMITDLDKSEVRAKFSRQAVSADEVIDMHQFISQGDAAQLLRY